MIKDAIEEPRQGFRPRPRRSAARRWVRDLATSVKENRRLNRRVAELTDVVAELLVPLADRDEEKARELLAATARRRWRPEHQATPSSRVVGRVEEDVAHLGVRLAQPSLDLVGRLLELVDAGVVVEVDPGRDEDLLG